MSSVVEPMLHRRERDPLIALAESGLLPDALLRMGIRRLCARRLHEEGASDCEAAMTDKAQRIAAMQSAPLALHTDLANAQHYELPSEFFTHCLGPQLKYSCCHFEHARSTLAEAEEAMLQLYAQRAELADGQDILELGCGWGSLTLWMATHYPRARITAVSNSHGQRTYIQQQARARNLGNIEVITCDVNVLERPPQAYDRVVSIEMFEHVRNHALLLERIAGWLRSHGKLFVHIFCHRELLYPFESEGKDDWMGRYFFSGGVMPSEDMLLHFQRHLHIEHAWTVDGRHYQRTAEAWLANQDAARSKLMPVLESVYGAEARLWWQRWRMFWMACAELFGYDHGQQWRVVHYRFARAG